MNSHEMNVYDLIKTGADKGLLVYDWQAPDQRITLRLLNLMVFEMPGMNKFIFSNSQSAKLDILEIFQQRCTNLNDYLPDRLYEYEILGRAIEFVDGLSIDFNDSRGKYIEYFEDALKRDWRKYCSKQGGLVLGINSYNKTCLLGAY